MEQVKNLEFICKSINESILFNDPFDHVYINNFFQEKFYINLIDSIPSKNDFLQLNKTGIVGKEYSNERYEFTITPESIEKLTYNSKQIITELVNIFLSPIFFKNISSKFNKTIENRIKNFSQEEIDLYGKNNLKFDFRLSFVKDYTRYKLGAHTDSIGKFLTFLFYLPQDESLQDVGTSLYKCTDSNIPKDDRHFSMEETNKYFVETKKVKYLPNSVLIFPRTNITYHGVSSINVGSKERNLLLLNFYLKKIEV